MRVVCDELHDVSMFHEVRNNREVWSHSHEGQNVFMLKPLRKDYSYRCSSCLLERLSGGKVYRLSDTLCVSFEGFPPHRW